MKGGITSGVVYPHALCELARDVPVRERRRDVGRRDRRRRRRRSRARPRAAAASRSSQRSRRGSETATTSSGSSSRSVGTRRYFRLLAAGARTEGRRRVAARRRRSARRSFPLTAVAGVAPGVALARARALDGTPARSPSARSSPGSSSRCSGSRVALGLRIALGLPKALGENGFGLCSGLSPRRQRTPGLTPWLADLLDDLAAKDDERPAHLRRPPREGHRSPGDDDERHPPAPAPDAVVEPRAPLRPGRAASALSRSGSSPGWRRTRHRRARAATAERTRRRLDALAPLRPLPAARRPAGGRRGADEPELPAPDQRRSAPRARHDEPARRVRRSRRSENGRACRAPARRRRLLVLRRRDREQLPGPLLRHAAADAADLRDRPRRLPPRPPTRRRRGRRTSTCPRRTSGGLLDTLAPDRPEARDLGSLTGFVSGIVRTMQNHVDATLTHQPGYRDRIVHVHTAPDEGGMNLAMPPDVIEALTLRGQAAGRALVERFADTPGTDAGPLVGQPPLGSLPERARGARRAARAVRPGLARNARRRAVVPRSSSTAATTWARPATGSRPTEQRALALTLTELLAEAGDRSETAETPVDRGSPRPEPVSRIVPGD